MITDTQNPIDYIPDYKTKEQFEMYIDSRKQDIKIIKRAIKEAKIMKKNLTK